MIKYFYIYKHIPSSKSRTNFFGSVSCEEVLMINSRRSKISSKNSIVYKRHIQGLVEDAGSIPVKPRLEGQINAGGMIFRKYANPFQPNSANMPALQSAKRKLELQQPKILHLVPLADWVQAWPMPLTGAGPIQNLHQVGADETAE